MGSRKVLVHPLDAPINAITGLYLPAMYHVDGNDHYIAQDVDQDTTSIYSYDFRYQFWNVRSSLILACAE